MARLPSSAGILVAPGGGGGWSTNSASSNTRIGCPGRGRRLATWGGSTLLAMRLPRAGAAAGPIRANRIRLVRVAPGGGGGWSIASSPLRVFDGCPGRGRRLGRQELEYERNRWLPRAGAAAGQQGRATSPARRVAPGGGGGWRGKGRWRGCGCGCPGRGRRLDIRQICRMIFAWLPRAGAAAGFQVLLIHLENPVAPGGGGGWWCGY